MDRPPDGFVRINLSTFRWIDQAIHAQINWFVVYLPTKIVSTRPWINLSRVLPYRIDNLSRWIDWSCRRAEVDRRSSYCIFTHVSSPKVYSSQLKSLVFQNIAKHSGRVENRGPRLHAAIERITRYMTQLKRCSIFWWKNENRSNCVN